MKNFYPLIKEISDRVFAFSLLCFLLPILIILSLIVLIKLGRPIFFKQLRPGYLGKPFYLIKFRSMRNLKDSEGKSLSDEKRLTSFGRILRTTSLDELPSLINILCGDMSFIGPRPLLMEYLKLYTDEQNLRHLVKPGFSGLAQINGRNNLPWEARFKLDTWYANHVSLWLDLRILFITFWKVIAREGINAPGEATVKRFTGSEN